MKGHSLQIKPKFLSDTFIPDAAEIWNIGTPKGIGNEEDIVGMNADL